jgi:hypothetical protein
MAAALCDRVPPGYGAWCVPGCPSSVENHTFRQRSRRQRRASKHPRATSRTGAP